MSLASEANSVVMKVQVVPLTSFRQRQSFLLFLHDSPKLGRRNHVLNIKRIFIRVFQTYESLQRHSRSLRTEAS